MSCENTAQFFLKKAAHSYSQLFHGGLRVDGSAAALVATKVSPENVLPAKEKHRSIKTASPLAKAINALPIKSLIV
jgi:hypothetical protein